MGWPVKSPRKERWLSLLEVATLLKLDQQHPARRRRYVLRFIRRVEARTQEKISKLFGNRVYVSLRAVEMLVPHDTEALVNVERDLAALGQKHRELARKVRGHGSRLRKLETAQQHTTDYLAKMAELGWVTGGS